MKPSPVRLGWPRRLWPRSVLSEFVDLEVRLSLCASLAPGELGDALRADMNVSRRTWARHFLLFRLFAISSGVICFISRGEGLVGLLSAACVASAGLLWPWADAWIDRAHRDRLRALYRTHRDALLRLDITLMENAKCDAK